MTNSSKKSQNSSKKIKFDSKKLGKQVKNSGCFNEAEYLKYNPDVAAAVERGEVKAFDHFIKNGVKENRKFSAHFDAEFYVKQHVDVAAEIERGETTAVLHFFQKGIKENRKPNALFDPKIYLDLNADVKAVVEKGKTTAIGHFFQFGFAENRTASSFYSAVLNPSYFQATNKQQIGSFFDVQSATQLSSTQIASSIVAEKASFVDVKYCRKQHKKELEAFYGFSVEELSEAQIKTFVCGKGETLGLSKSAFKVEAYRLQFAAQLTAFFKVTDIKQVTQEQVVEFMVGEGLKQGIDLSIFVDLKYYQETYSAALIDRFGSSFTSKDIIDFVFGDAAEFLDEDYYKALYGDILTGDGIRVADLDFKELKDYVFTEGWKDDKKLSAFNISGYCIRYAAQLSLHYFGSSGSISHPPSGSGKDSGKSGGGKNSGKGSGKDSGKSGGGGNNSGDSGKSGGNNLGGNSNVNKLTDKQIVKFMFGEGLKLGINPIEFVSITEVRQIFSIELTKKYKVTSVTEVSDNLVLDFLFGGVSEKIDYDYCRKTFQAQLTAAFGISIEKITDNQILDYVYREGLAKGFKLSAIDFDAYIQRYQTQIAAYFKIGVDAIADLDFKELKEFAFGKGLELGLNLTGLVDVNYCRSNFTAAIASFYQVTVEAVATFTDEQVLNWCTKEFPKIDLDFVRYQFAQLTIEQKTSIFASLGITAETSSILSVEQVVKIAYSEQFKAIVKVESASFAAIDIKGFRIKYKDALHDCFCDDDDKPTTPGTPGTPGTGNSGNSGNDSGKPGNSDTSGKPGNSDTSGKPGNSDGSKNSGKSGNDSGKSGSDSGSSGGTGGNPGNSGKPDDDDCDVSDLTDKQVLKFIFGKGWKQGINIKEFVNISYLRQSFEFELTAHYEVSAVAQLSDELVLDFVYGGISAELDYEYYSATYRTSLEATFGVSIEKLSKTQILDHAYRIGLAQDFKLSPIDLDGYADKYEDAIAGYFKIDKDDVITLSKKDLKAFALGEGIKLGLDVSAFVDVNYYQQTKGESILSNYRQENVFNVDDSQTRDFLLNGGEAQGLNTSKAVDLNWYKQQYAADLAANQTAIDKNANSTVEDGELFDYVTGEGLQKGQNPSKLVDFQAYRTAGSASAQALLAYYQKTDITQISYQQTLEYMYSIGLSSGYNPSNSLDLNAIRTTNAQAIASYYQVQSIEQVSYTQTFSYSFGAGYSSIGSAIS